LGLTGGVGEEDGFQNLRFVCTGFINRNLPFLSDSLHKNAVSFFFFCLIAVKYRRRETKPKS